MPRSRNRKDQKKKSRQRTEMLKKKKAKQQKELMQFLQQAQQEAIAKQASEDNKNVVELDEDLGDFEL